jgi:hypothetical protein
MATTAQRHLPDRFDRSVTAVIRGGNTLVVILYKIVGFAVLFAILATLTSYLLVRIFFFLSASWVTPVILSPTDDNLLRIESEISEQELARDRMLADRIEMISRIRNLEQHGTIQKVLQAGLRQTIQGGHADRMAEATTLQRAADALLSVNQDTPNANDEYAKQLQSSTEQLAGAHLLTQDELIQRKYQVSQLAVGNANIAQHDADLEVRLRTLQRESDSLDAAGAPDPSRPSALTFNVLQMKAQLDSAGLLQRQDRESERELLNRMTLQDGTLTRIDTFLASLYASPYLRAGLHGEVLAFVPYRNLQNVWPKRALYTCRFTLVWCSRAGEVVSVLPGEVQGKDPVSGRDQRGVYVEINLSQKQAAQQPVLYLGNRPLWL